MELLAHWQGTLWIWSTSRKRRGDLWLKDKEQWSVVTATESVGAHGNPNYEIEGAVTDTLEEGEFVHPPIVTPATIPIVHAEAITNFVGGHENPSSEIEGAVTATVEDG
ncbi:hypothetical protein F2Q68_00010369 [Brassica cretica]|uniref:Uncharacterized protein n=1 Tax=Brassica cretica TaxID=69181 RepID=A0A8S9L6D9_BRACR|nr:hypothetical protein F2Q68_00010369 [Brassica cretica]